MVHCWACPLFLAVFSFCQGTPVCEFAGRNYDGTVEDLFDCPALATATQFSVAFTFSMPNPPVSGYMIKLKYTGGYMESKVRGGGDISWANVNFSTGSGVRTTLYSGSPHLDTCPVRYLLTQSHTHLRLYKEGVLLAEDMGEHTGGGITQVRFGGASNNNPSLVGHLQDVQLYDAEISWTGPTTVTCAGMSTTSDAVATVASTMPTSAAESGSTTAEATTTAMATTTGTTTSSVESWMSTTWEATVPSTMATSAAETGATTAGATTTAATTSFVDSWMSTTSEAAAVATVASTMATSAAESGTATAEATTTAVATTTAATASSVESWMSTTLEAAAVAIVASTVATSAVELGTTTAVATTTAATTSSVDSWMSTTSEAAAVATVVSTMATSAAESGTATAEATPTAVAAIAAVASTMVTSAADSGSTVLPLSFFSTPATTLTLASNTSLVTVASTPADTSSSPLGHTSYAPLSGPTASLRTVSSNASQPTSTGTFLSTSTLSSTGTFLSTSHGHSSEVPQTLSTTSTLSLTTFSTSPQVLPVPEMLKSLSQVEAAALEAGINVTEVEHTRMVARAFRPQETLSLRNWQVSLPPSLAQGKIQGKVVEAFTMVLPDGPAEEGFAGLISISAYSKGGVPLPVSGLAEPIRVVAPVSEPQRVAAVRYWHEGSKQWRGEGLSILARGEATLDFATTHLTLFAMVLQGFLNAFACAQLGLFSKEGLQGLASGDWFLGSFALLFWCILSLLASLLLFAWWLDRRTEGWTDEHFLVPLGPPPALPSDPAAMGDEEEGAEEEGAGGSRCKSFAAMPCHGGSMARDILDDICARWFAFFGELRDLCEAMCGGLQVSGLQRGKAIANQVVESLVAGNARRQAGASVGLSDDTISFLLEDEDFGHFLMESATGPALMEQSKASLRRRDWLDLHRSVVDNVDLHWRDFDGCRKLPMAVWRLFRASHPVLSLLRNCRLRARLPRALLFSCEILGALALAALFFDGSGMALKKGADEACDSDDQNPWVFVGQLIGIALSSALLANMPVMLLESLQSKGLKRLPYEGCPEWQKQLRLWRLQDGLLWVLGGIYCTCCTFFICLFLANVAETELPSWGTGALIQAVEEQLAIPLLVGLSVPCLTVFSLLLLACLSTKEVGALLQEQRRLREGKGNWQAFMHSI